MNSTDSPPVLASRDQHILMLTLNRPHRHNALAADVIDALVEELQLAANDDDVRVAVIRGAGPSFCSGYDLSPEQRSEYTSGLNLVTDYRRLETLRKKWSVIRDFPKPLVAGIHGHCLAGGTDLLLACDISIAADNASIGMPNVRSLGISLLLPMWERILGGPRSKLYAFTGDSMSGAQAAEFGFVSLSVDASELDAEVARVANRIAMVPPQIVALAKQTLNHRWRSEWEELSAMGTALDAIAHGVDDVVQFWQLAARDGLKSTLDARDAPFRPGAPRTGSAE